MRTIIRAIAAAIAFGAAALASPLARAEVGPDGLIQVRSAYGVDETIARIRKDIAAKGILFFQAVDQSKLAAEAGIALPPSTLLTFGNPPLGAQFLTSNPNSGLDWPVRLLVRQDAGGAVWAVYTDFGLFSCHEGIGRDVTDLFNVLTGYSSPAAFRTLLVAPLNLRTSVKDLIEREASWARHGHAAHMVLKVNALGDQDIVASLYQASTAGVRIDLIVRGICCLRPGIAEVSDNIRVRSVVGRFLEHSRMAREMMRL